MTSNISSVQARTARMLLRLTAGVVFAVLTLSAGADNFKKVVVFGDSLSDNGNLFRLSGGAFPPAPYFQGRFSNGPVWVEDFVRRIDGELEDHAFGGAFTGALNSDSAVVPGAPGMATSVAAYLLAHKHAEPEALYVVWGGANDYFNGLTNPFATVGNIAAEVDALANAGARTFLIPNLPDLDALPATLTLDPVTRGGLNFLTAVHNAVLAGAIQNLQLAHPKVTFYLMDVHTFVAGIRANPADFNLTNVSDRAIFVSPSTALGYLFWDDVHPSVVGHRLLSDLALDTVNPSRKHNNRGE